MANSREHRVEELDRSLESAIEEYTKAKRRARLNKDPRINSDLLALEAKGRMLKAFRKLNEEIESWYQDE